MAKKPLEHPKSGGAGKKLIASLGMGKGALKTFRSLSKGDRKNLLGIGATKWDQGEHKGESMVQRTLKNTMHARKAAGMKPTTGEKVPPKTAPVSGSKEHTSTTQRAMAARKVGAASGTPHTAARQTKADRAANSVKEMRERRATQARKTRRASKSSSPKLSTGSAPRQYS